MFTMEPLEGQDRSLMSPITALVKQHMQTGWIALAALGALAVPARWAHFVALHVWTLREWPRRILTAGRSARRVLRFWLTRMEPLTTPLG